MEQERTDCSNKIEQLKQTINGQELSQEDVRRMEREKVRIEEQITKHSSVLDGHVAALTEAKEKWSAVYQLLEERVTEYKMKARQLELIPKTAKHAKGVTLEVVLDKSKAADGEVELLGGMNLGLTVKEHVAKTVQEYESETAKEQRRIMELKAQIQTTDNAFVKLIEDIEVSVRLVLLEYQNPLEQSFSSAAYLTIRAISTVVHQKQNHIVQRRWQSSASRPRRGNQQQSP